MGNPRAFEGVREHTQFRAAGKESLNAKIDIKVTEKMRQQLKAIPGWQAKLRSAIAELIEAHSLNSDAP